MCVLSCSVVSDSSQPHGLYSLPGSSVHGISMGKNTHARILEWVAISSSRDLPNPGIEPESLVSAALAHRFFTTTATWETHIKKNYWLNIFYMQLFSSLKEKRKHFKQICSAVDTLTLCWGI